MDRALSFIVDLRRSFPLFFIPLEPYPARSARHLPHAGKALSVDILFPHMRVFALTMREKRGSVALVNCLLETHFPFRQKESIK